MNLAYLPGKKGKTRDRKDRVRERLAADIRSSRTAPARTRLGSTYWATLRQKYGGDEELSKIEIPEDECANPKLKKAMVRATDSSWFARSIEPMTSYLRSAASINRKEILGMLTAARTPQAMAKRHVDVILFELLNCVARLGVWDQVKDCLLAGKDMFDESATYMWNQALKGNTSWLAWIEVLYSLSCRPPLYVVEPKIVDKTSIKMRYRFL